MKAVLMRSFGGPEVLTLEDVPDPSPGPGQVLVRIKAAGVNPVETYVRTGNYSFKPDLPYVLGTDAAGIVEAAGSGVTEFAAGHRVYLHGTPRAAGRYAERVAADASHVHHLPDSVSFAQGAALGVPYATAWAALFLRANARPGETVLVHGASGGVGVAALQIARAHGLRVIGTAGTDAGLALARREGADQAFDHTKPDYLDRILEGTGGTGPNVILEMLANVNLDRDLDILALKGRVVVIGSRGRIDFDPRKTMRKDATIRGMLLFNMTTEELRETHAGLIGGMEAGYIRPVVGRELPMRDAAAAHEAVMQPGAHGKIVLVP